MHAEHVGPERVALPLRVSHRAVTDLGSQLFPSFISHSDRPVPHHSRRGMRVTFWIPTSESRYTLEEWRVRH